MGKGNKFENYVKQKLYPYGFYITRSAASKGVFDLIVLTPGENINVGIQCKGGEQGFISAVEKEEAIKTAERYNIIPVLAAKQNGSVVFLDMRTDEPINFAELREVC